MPPFVSFFLQKLLSPLILLVLAVWFYIHQENSDGWGMSWHAWVTICLVVDAFILRHPFLQIPGKLCLWLLGKGRGYTRAYIWLGIGLEVLVAVFLSVLAYNTRSVIVLVGTIMTLFIIAELIYRNFLKPQRKSTV